MNNKARVMRSYQTPSHPWYLRMEKPTRLNDEWTMFCKSVMISVVALNRVGCVAESLSVLVQC